MILLIEDNPNDVLLTLRAFRQLKINCEVVVVRDGAEALDFLLGSGAWHARNIEEMPRLILLDLKLPKLNGHELIRHIRQNQATSLLPIVVLSTSGEESDVRESYRLGANSYLQKPVSFDDFTRTISNISSYWLNLNIVA